MEMTPKDLISSSKDPRGGFAVVMIEKSMNN
jgi:hypothetical protein